MYSKIPAFFRGSVIALALLLVCTPDQEPSGPGNQTSDGIKVSVDDNGSISSTTVIKSDSSMSLTVNSGTTLLILNADGNYVPVSSGSDVKILMNSKTVDKASDDEKIYLNAFSISATVDGVAAELLFKPGELKLETSVPNTGVTWETSSIDTNVHDGAYLKLYKRNSDGDFELLNGYTYRSQSLSKKSNSSSGMNSYPDGTGEYRVAIDNSSPGKSSSSIPASGVYTEVFTNPKVDRIVNINGKSLGGPVNAERVLLKEPSTNQFLAEFKYIKGTKCQTYTDPHDGAQYWVEWIEDSIGRTAGIKTAATVANLMKINMELVTLNDNLHSEDLNVPPDDGVVHAPDGQALANPYEDKQRKFGGLKNLIFKLKEYSQAQDVKDMLSKAGYKLPFSIPVYNNLELYVNLGETQDARKLIQEDVLRKNNWFAVQENTEGNVGYYIHNDSLIVDVTTHSYGETVSSKTVTIKGTIKNPSNDSDPVKEVYVLNRKLTGLDSTKAVGTVTDSGTAFSVTIDLFPGNNVMTFFLKGKDENGDEKYFLNYTFKVKGTKSAGLMLDYDAAWTGVLTITSTKTTTTPNPDTSVLIEKQTIKANLKYQFYSTKLSYVQLSHENALTCSETDNCELFHGTSGNAPVSVTENIELWERDCDGNLPMVKTRSAGGNAELTKYQVIVAATLTPWAEGNNSTTRKYHLKVKGGADFTKSTDPAWPSGDDKSYDCLTKTWDTEKYLIGRNISLDKSDIPPVLNFSGTDDLEKYVNAPVAAKTWNFSGQMVSSDSSVVTKYTATLTINP